MKYSRHWLLGVFNLLLTLLAVGQVEVSREPLTLPTYGVREPEIMPDWRMNRYPYTMMDRLTNEKGLRTYNALYVENEYVKALVLPELGGRLHGAQDKTNGYEFLYDQKVIKPGLVSLTGAWISGGVEWNFPAAHRPSGFRDTDWAIVENQDSSKSVWVGEFERLKGMRWSVGTTVHPGRNWVETKVRLENSTPFIQSFQYWATSAVRATHNYQAVIPGEFMTGHEQLHFTRWPVHEGVDISYWKNSPGSTSYFSVDSESDFFGGYSPEEKAGMVHVADHHIVRGKKLWTWGTAPAGRLWEKILTDGDLPYFEPQAGAYSDNQPDLFWMMPGETKIFSHFWFPVKDIGVFDYANLEGSINLEVSKGKALFGWSPTGMNRDVHIIVKYKGAEIYHELVDADPANPFLGEVSVSGLEDLYKLRMIVISSVGDTLLAFNHRKPQNPSFPEAASLPPDPADVSSQDMLFMYGDKFYRYDESEKATLYFNEALKRDPGDLRSNTSMGEMALKKGLNDLALKYFNQSIQRDDTFFKAWYYKGITQIRRGNLADAEKCLMRSSYGQEWYAIAHFELAQLMASQNLLNRALEHIDKSIRSNGFNSQAHSVKALILVQLGRSEEAMKLVRANQIADPLNLFSKYMQVTAASASGNEDDVVDALEREFLNLSRSDHENHIELAIRFARCGNYQDAIHVLELIANQSEQVNVSPLVYYYQAYYSFLLGKFSMARDLHIKASGANPAYCFPYRLETFPVMKWALSENPDDAMAHYLLGFLLKKNTRLKEAAVHWEQSVVLNPLNAVAQRNLGQVYYRQNDLLKAQKAYQAAIKADPQAGKAIVELGLINKELKISYDDQIGLFEDHKDIVLEYQPAVSQLVELYLLTGRNSEALKLLSTIHFNSWEGKYEIHQFWVQCHIKEGDRKFEKGDIEGALWHYKQSLRYPENLEVAEQPNTVHARKNYKIAAALERLGKKDEAHAYYKDVVADKVPDGHAYQYFRGKAMEALKEKQKAKRVYENMLDTLTREQSKSDHAISLFTRSLALEGLGKRMEADNMRSQAFELNPLVEIRAFRPAKAGH